MRHYSVHPCTGWMSKSQRGGNVDRSEANNLGNLFSAGSGINQEQVTDLEAGVSFEVKTESTLRSC